MAQKVAKGLMSEGGDEQPGRRSREELDAEARQIANNHLEILDRFLHGTDVVTGQVRST